MFTPLSERQNFKLNQSAAIRKQLDLEDKLDARELEAERQAKLEAEYKESVCVGEGRLRYEWTETGTGSRVKHQKTGMLMLDGDRVGDGDTIAITVSRKKTPVKVRYIYSGQLREIQGVVGDTDTGESISLTENMKAEWIETEAEAERTDWHVRLRDGKISVVKEGGLCAGEFTDIEIAQDLAEALNAQDEIISQKLADKAKEVQYIKYRRAGA